LALLTPWLAIALWGQQQSPTNYSGDVQNSNTADCADPLLASSSQCSGSLQGEQTRTALPGGYGAQTQEYGAQTQNRANNYSDTEQLSRQASARKQTQPTMLPPEPLTEFQKFVGSTSGQILSIFGANLFRSVPSTFAPLDMTPVPSDYVLGPGDELRIRIWGQVSFQANVRVDRSGDIYLPQVGLVHVAGLSFSALDKQMRGAIGRVYRNFDLTVDVGQIRAIQVYVSGQARRPGVYTVSSLSTLVDALFASGGPSLQGSMRHIELKRGSEVVTTFDLYNLLVHGDKSKDVKLLSGDVIFIPSVGAQVAVTGSVRNSAIYELRENESLGDLIADAGGVSAVAAEARVSIERIEEHRDRHAMEVAYDPSGLATPLAEGDLVHVFSIVPKYSKTVTLRGNIANSGRFAWHAGMHVSDLIPDKESLITRNYWWKRAQLGLPVPEFEATPGFAEFRQPAENHAITIKTPPPSEDNILAPSGSSSSSSSGMQQNPRQSAQQRAGGSSLGSAQADLSNRTFRTAPRTEISLLAPEIDWDYAVIERLDQNTLKTVLIPFDLGKLVLQHDASQDMELQPGDAVSILSEADIRVPIAEQTKMVALGGEFAHAGVYTVQPGETLRHLVERAGGFTPNAYLYGSDFTRESTRVVQQARIDEYVQNQSMQIQRNNLAMAGSATGSAQGLASNSAAQSSQQSLLASLQQIRATGRIVLKFTPDSSGINTIPDIMMEDGDRFVVPSVPATVNVVGAVYDQNSFLYAPGKRISSYLKLAGGPNRDADRKHEFIIRANGEVVSHEVAKGPWGNEFSNLLVNPGDTVIVPEKKLKPSAMNGVMGWSQMFSQFALGAASMNAIY
jgi:protein involved in polysaccharide export with SLBB domain